MHAPTDLQQPNEGVLQRNHFNSMLLLHYDQLKEQNIDEWTTIISVSSLQLFTVLKDTTCSDSLFRPLACGWLLNPADSEAFLTYRNVSLISAPYSSDPYCNKLHLLSYYQKP